MKDQCETCKWQYLNTVDVEAVLECRNKPPECAGFPRVNEDDSCGSWKASPKHARFCMEPGDDGSVCVLHPNHDDESLQNRPIKDHTFAVFEEE